jgi:hypothetical protein
LEDEEVEEGSKDDLRRLEGLLSRVGDEGELDDEESEDEDAEIEDDEELEELGGPPAGKD